MVPHCLLEKPRHLRLAELGLCDSSLLFVPSLTISYTAMSEHLSFLTQAQPSPASLGLCLHCSLCLEEAPPSTSFKGTKCYLLCEALLDSSW